MTSGMAFYIIIARFLIACEAYGGTGLVSKYIEMIQIKIRELIIFIIVIALFSSLLINCSQHSLIKALEHSIEQRDSLLNESFKLKY